MFLLQLTFAEWMQIPVVVGNIIGWVIIVKFLKEKIGSLNESITSLKLQIEAQKGIVESAKMYSDLFSPEKIKYNLELTESNANKKAEQKIAEIQSELDIVNKKLLIATESKVQLEVSKAQLESYLPTIQNELAQKELERSYPNYRKNTQSDISQWQAGTTMHAWGNDVYNLIEEYIDSQPLGFDYIPNDNLEEDSDLIKYIRQRSDIADKILTTHASKESPAGDLQRGRTIADWSYTRFVGHKALEKQASDYAGVRKIYQKYGLRLNHK